MFILIKIGFTNVAQNSSTNVTQNWFHECYLKQTLKRYSRLVSRVLLEIDPKRYSNWSTGVTQIDPQMLLRLIQKCCSKYTHKRYLKLVPQVLLEIFPQVLLKLILWCYSNWPRHVTQIDRQVLLKIDPQTLLKIDP